MVELRRPILCLVTDTEACLGRPLEQVVAAAVRAGVGLVQLRQKGASARQLLQSGQSLMETLRRSGAALVVNDRVDVAMALDADGAHLGGGSLPVAEARRLMGRGKLIGVSVHSLEEAIKAEEEGADYLVLGTIFETRSHPGLKPAGLQLVRDVAAVVRIPVVAIGGIKADNAGAVVTAGAAGVAVITSIQSARDVAAATRSLLQSMQSVGAGPAGDPLEGVRESWKTRW